MTDIGVYDIHICPMIFVFEIQVQAPLVVRMFSFIIVLFCATQEVDYGRQLDGDRGGHSMHWIYGRALPWHVQFYMSRFFWVNLNLGALTNLSASMAKAGLQQS